MEEQTSRNRPEEREDSPDEPRQPERRRWQEPVLERRETLPRVTNAFASSFEP